MELVRRFPENFLFAQPEHIERGLVGKLDLDSRGGQDDAHVQVLKQGAEAFFAGKERVHGARYAGRLWLRGCTRRRGSRLLLHD
jgi:hypothetical protein